jgi:hypothetical protein
VLHIGRHFAVLIEQASRSAYREVFNFGENYIVEFFRQDKPRGIPAGLRATDAGCVV